MNNPYIIVGIIIAVDIISIPFFIKSILKKDIKRKGAVIALVLAAFIALEAFCSFLYVTSNQFYDRNGNTYTDIQSVIYYTREGDEFKLEENSLKYKHFVSTDGKQMYIAERVYIDMDGFIVYDRKNEFERSDREYVYLDSDGNEYFLAEYMKWDYKGNIKLKDNAEM